MGRKVGKGMAKKTAKKTSVSIVIPTFNERGNIEKLVPEIFKNCSGLNADVEVVIVDDNSPDGTGSLADGLARKYNVKAIHRTGKLGLASAVIKGFEESKSEILGAMDADRSHPAEVLPRLIEPLLSGKADIAVGSRYVKGGGVEVWPFHRRIVSRVATLLAKPLTPVKDTMSGLFFLRRNVIEGVNLSAKGYKIGLEVLVKGNYGKVCEVPYMFRNRFYGKSKLTFTEYINYLRNVLAFAAYKITHNRKRAKVEYVEC